jgi:hypothetical protein
VLSQGESAKKPATADRLPRPAPVPVVAGGAAEIHLEELPSALPAPAGAPNAGNAEAPRRLAIAIPLRKAAFVPAEPPPLPHKSAVEGWLKPADETLVKQSIQRGLRYLRATQTPSGTWGDHRHPVGLAALPALAMLECGVPTNDPAIQRAAEFVRRQIPDLDKTYEISLAILFLDRLREPQDRKTIVTLACRLLGGQYPDGGWTYTCPILSETDEANLLLALELTRPRTSDDLYVKTSQSPLLKIYGPKNTTSKSLDMFVDEQNRKPTRSVEEILLVDSKSRAEPGNDAKPDADGDLKKPAEDRPEKPAPEAPKAGMEEERGVEIKALPPALRNIPALQPAWRFQQMQQRDMRFRMTPKVADNSNTQFGIIGLWAARRYQVPMDRALALLVWRFHTSQHADGSWGYKMDQPMGRPSMTGAALLGLAVGHGLILPNGAAVKHKIPFDPRLAAGLHAMVTQPTLQGRGRKGRGPGGHRDDLYFWWTVERVAVLYGIRNIDGYPWYNVGVAVILPRQQGDGSWDYHMAHGNNAVGTSFALMFLRGCNLVSDLTQTLRGPAPRKN